MAAMMTAISSSASLFPSCNCRFNSQSPPLSHAAFPRAVSPPSSIPLQNTPTGYFNTAKNVARTRRSRCSATSSEDRTAVVTPPQTSTVADEDDESASVSATSSEIVRQFYGGINKGDLAFVEDLIAQNCVYEDLVFSQPFVGRKAIFEFFQTFIGSISRDLQFVIDDISEEDKSAVGVIWHLEWKGKPFPFSKGCSFYRLDVVNGKRQIIYGRDCVEPAIKSGAMALTAIRGVTWLLQRFPQLADRL